MRKPTNEDDPYGFIVAKPGAFDTTQARPRARPSAWRRPAKPGTFNLYVDLVPSSAWFSNLRAELEPGEWKLIQKHVFSSAGYCCEICEGKGPKWPVECHERWRFDERTGIQKLLRLEALCPECHETTHIGLASVRGNQERALQRLETVNGWPRARANDHVKAAFEVFRRRSERPWTLDASHLLTLPIKYGAKTIATIERHAALAAKLRVADQSREGLLQIILPGDDGPAT